MIVLGIDVDTHEIGICWLKDDRVLYLATLHLKGKSLPERIAHMVHLFANLNMTVPPDIAAFEDRNVERGYRANGALNQMVGGVKATLIAMWQGPCPPSLTFQIVDVNTSAAKAAVGLSTSMAKGMTKVQYKEFGRKHVAMICAAQGAPEPQDSHQADAFMVARAAYLDAKIAGEQASPQSDHGGRR